MNEILWGVTRASALVSLVLLTGSVVLGALTAGRRAPLSVSPAVRTGLHRTLAGTAFGFVVLHVATVVLDGYVDIPLTAALVPFTSPYDRWWVGLGTVAFDLLLVIMISSWLRRRLPYRAWRVLHWLTYAMWPVAIAHGLGASTTDGTIVLGLAIGCTVVGLGAIGWRAFAPVADTTRRRLVAQQEWR